MIKLIPLGYVNNYENRYLEDSSKAAVYKILSVQITYKIFTKKYDDFKILG